MGTAILEENVALFRKKKCVHALRQGNSTRGCLLWDCVAGAEKKGTQAPTAKGEDIWNVMEEVWGSQEREIHRGCGQTDWTLRWEKKKWKINTTAQWYYMDYLCLLSIETKHTQQPNPRYSCHRNETYVHVPKGTHRTVHTYTLCNSPTLQTTAGPKAEWFNCYVLIKLIN